MCLTFVRLGSFVCPLGLCLNDFTLRFVNYYFLLLRVGGICGFGWDLFCLDALGVSLLAGYCGGPVVHGFCFSFDLGCYAGLGVLVGLVGF